jgi:ribosomal protein L37AE/L43A
MRGSNFVYCEKCGKKLLNRLPNGIWQFKFGKGEVGESVIDMEIFGSIKMTCIRKSCRHVNTFNYFPNNP